LINSLFVLFVMTMDGKNYGVHLLLLDYVFFNTLASLFDLPPAVEE
jgi:hypothetical protein